jgi:hypothetical protein
MTSKTNKIISAVIAIAIILSVIVLIYVNLPKQTETTEEDNTTPPAQKENPNTSIFSLIYNDDYYNYSLGQIERLEPYTAKGGYRTQTGFIKGFGNYTGVNITTLINTLESVPYQYSLQVTDSTGESILYNFSTIRGDVNIYDPENASNPNPIGNGNMTMVLAYQFEGSYLNETNDGNLKIVFLDQHGSITQSSLWWKKVVSIRIITE